MARTTHRYRRRALLCVAIVLLGLVPSIAASKHVSADTSYRGTVLADSPSVLYRLDEASGTTAADSSGNSVTGTYGASGLTYATTGALSSDSNPGITTSGASTVVSASATSLPLNASARTVEIWAKTSTAGKTMIMYGGPDTAYQQFDFYLAVSGGVTYIEVYLGGAHNLALVSPVALVDNVYHLYDAVYDGATTVTFFVDGQQSGSLSTGSSLSTSSSNGLKVGNDPGGAAFVGSLDEAAIYPSALTAAKVNAHWRAATTGAACPSAASGGYGGAVVANSPVKYYAFNETSGSAIADLSGNCAMAAYRNGVSHVTGAPVGDGGSAISGTLGTLATTGIDGIPGGSSSRTFELWAKTSAAGAQNLLEYGTESLRGMFDLAINSGSNNFEVYLGSGQGAVAPAPYKLNDGNFHFYAASYDGSVITMYVDGQEQMTYSPGAALATVTNATPLMMGNDGSTGFNTSIDEVAVFNTALTPAQIGTHFRNSTGSACPATPTTGYGAVVVADTPLRYYPYPESTGIVAQDYSGNCRPAAYGYGVSRIPGAEIADLSQAVSADGTLPMGAISADGLPYGASARTVETWFNTTTAGHGILQYGKDTTLGDVSVLLYSSTQPEVYTGNGGGQLWSSGSSLSDGRWHHLAVSYDGATTMIMYIDGVSLGTKTLSGPLATPTTATPLLVGAESVTVGWPGGLQGPAIYDHTLTAARVLAHYNAGRPTGAAAGTSALVSESELRGGGNFCLPCTVQNILHAVFGAPVDSATGNMYHTFGDILIPGRGIPILFSRTYNSTAAATNGPLGYGWTFNDSISLSLDGSSNATITQENGSTVFFTNNAGTYSAPPRVIATLVHNGDGTWTFTRQKTQVITFNSSGQVTQEKDLNNEATSFSYTAGKLTTITDAAGRTLTIGWTGSLITSLTDANITPSRTVSYQYNDGLGNLTDVIDVNGGHSSFTYDASHRMTAMKSPACYVSGCPGIQTHYDSNGRVDWQKDELNRQTTFSYSGDITTVTDPVGNVTVEYYSGGVKVGTTRGSGTADAGTWLYSHDVGSLGMTATRDPNGHIWTATVDANGNTTGTTDPLGRTTSATYNSLNEPLTQVDGKGVTTTMTYDAGGNLLTVSTPLTGTSPLQTQQTTYHHDTPAHPGDVTSVTDANGKVWTYTYDTYGNKTSSKDPLNDKTTWTYNADGWTLTRVTPKGDPSVCSSPCTPSQYTVTYSYTDPDSGSRNNFGDVAQMTDQLGHVTVNKYDVNRNLTGVKDANTNFTTYTYDLANEQLSVNRADSPQTTLQTAYNDDGTVHTQTDGNGKVTTYAYDHRARVTSVTDPLGNTTTLAYDAAGNQLSKQDPTGDCSTTPKVKCTTMAYDTANQLAGVTYSDGVTPNVSSISYDNDGQRTGMTDGTGSSSWAYDSLHRLTSYTNGNGAMVSYDYLTPGSGYDLKNQVGHITYPNSVGTVTRAYDDAGRLTSVKDWNNKTTTFGYDVNSNEITQVIPSTLAVTDTFGFNAADQMTSVSVSNGLTLFSATYTRDNNGQLASDSSVPATTGSYKYTPLNQVCYGGSSSSSACSSPPVGSQPFGYDKADNLTIIGSTTQKFNDGNQLCWTSPTASTNACASTPTGGTSYGYDNRGNRTSQVPAVGSATCDSYDQANRLTKVQTGTGSSCTSPTTVATYAYDGSGLRQSKGLSGTTTQYVWDQSGGLPSLLDEKAGAANPTYYIYGPGGMPVEQIDTAGTAHYYHHDQLGSTRLISSAAGTSENTYTYDPYGNTVSSTGTVTNPLRYTGEFLDSESGLYYLRARYYDPTTAEFLTRDPATASTRRPYAYTAGNPLIFKDPSGLDDWIGYDCPGCRQADYRFETISGGEILGVSHTKYYAYKDGAYVYVGSAWAFGVAGGSPVNVARGEGWIVGTFGQGPQYGQSGTNPCFDDIKSFLQGWTAEGGWGVGGGVSTVFSPSTNQVALQVTAGAQAGYFVGPSYTSIFTPSPPRPIATPAPSGECFVDSGGQRVCLPG